jgi:hypothetical protein
MIKRFLVNSQKAISETIDGETIIINLDTGCYYSMNLHGTALWNALISGKAISTENPQVESFLALLLEDGLIIEIAQTDSPVADEKEFTEPKLDKYTDMQEMLLADPIHDVDTAGWPNLKKD